MKVSSRARPLTVAGKADRTALTVCLGNQPPLHAGTGRRAPDRRRVSIRWMTGSILTGLTSVLLMGGALHAALDGRQQLAQPASVLKELMARGDERTPDLRGDRPLEIIAQDPIAERIMQVPTVTKVGNRNVIRKRPFAYASAPLAALPKKRVDYPPFDPLAVFRSSSADKTIASSDVIYGAEIESEVSIQTVDFPMQAAAFDKTSQISALEAEQIVRQARPTLEEGEIEVAALPYLDTARFALKQSEVLQPSAFDVKVIAENVSNVLLEDDEDGQRDFSEDVVVVPPDQSLKAALSGLELAPAPLEGMVSALVGEFGTGPMPDGTRLRVAWEKTSAGTGRLPRRISVYRAGTHMKSVALNDQDRVVWAVEPAAIPATQDDGDSRRNRITSVSRSNLPNVYDGLYRAALSQGLTKDHARRVVRTVAFDVDFRNRITPKDSLEVFYSLEQGEEEATDDSEILYIGLDLSGAKRSYYRFKASDDGSVDYYDENGKSAKKFLLRKPVPNGKFRSPYGMRRHPISRTYKLHAGVDFSAPRGTPIIAAGNGKVEKIGWAGGYGRQMIIRHTNGYKTSYNHMHRFAKGMKVGARVVQGQIIGQVGSTGYSTGPHLHYEVSVNGNKVNPMKIRLPQGRALKGKVLAAFMRERDRIDALLDRGRGTEAREVASLN